MRVESPLVPRWFMLLVLLVVSQFTTGCIGFSGPNDVRNAIMKADQSVVLEKEHGINVGPLGIALATMFVGDEIPSGLNNVSAVDFGEYHISSVSSDGDTFSLCNLDLPKWETIVRVRDGRDQDLHVMIGTESSVRRMLVLNREGDTLHIVRVKGNFEKLLDALLAEGGLLDGDFEMDVGDW